MSFEQIRGHERIREILTRVIKIKRVPHAYLFSGIEGIGKRLFALSFSRLLLCKSSDPEQCGTCPACVQVERGSHPDLLTVEPENDTIPIDRIRNLKQQLSLKSFAGSYKIGIIDNAEKMTVQAENALLKTLEEPPPSSLIILITRQPYLLLPTIRSRCQHLNFEPIPTPELAEVIMTKRNVESTTAYLLAHLTGGSLGKALALDVDHCVKLKDSWAMISRHSGGKEGQNIFALVEDMGKEKDKIEVTLNFLRLWYRDAILHKLYGSHEPLVFQDKVEEIALQSSSWSMDRLLDALSWIEEYYAMLEYNVNPQLTLESLFLRLTTKSAGAPLQ